MSTLTREETTHVSDVSCISYGQPMNGLQVIVEGRVPNAWGVSVSVVLSREYVQLTKNWWIVTLPTGMPQSPKGSSEDKKEWKTSSIKISRRTRRRSDTEFQWQALQWSSQKPSLSIGMWPTRMATKREQIRQRQARAQWLDVARLAKRRIFSTEQTDHQTPRSRSWHFAKRFFHSFLWQGDLFWELSVGSGKEWRG